LEGGFDWNPFEVRSTKVQRVMETKKRIPGMVEDVFIDVYINHGHFAEAK
jgi:hypothetical protein